MGKRGNENSQMRREDYETLSSRGGGDEGPGRFQHATPQETSKRRVVKNKPNAMGTPAPFSFTNKGSFSSSTPSNGNSLIVRRYQNQACAFERSYLEKCEDFNSKYTDMVPLLDYYLDVQHVLETEYWKQCKETGEALKGNSTKAGSTPYPAAKPAPSPSPSFGGGGSLFGGASAAAPAPAGSLFGGAAAATPKAPSPGGSTNLFGVGAATGGTGTSFSFTTGKSSGSNPPPCPAAATPASTFTGGAGGGGEASDNPVAANEPSTVQKGDADKDWVKVEELEGVTDVYVSSDGKWKKQFNGTLKVQEHKQNKTKRLILRNEASGKVMLNM